ncbi:O-antigen ligase family protein [Microbispora hainanensis]|uniref:O-antigen ligase family protein n=1 Tax=Microbispora hainanensis TaxID=568844 RepID=A0ABZ1SID0_9ACTN|nr:O-antigen ligase family protein [Microbispora hainanensis]
MSAGLTAEAVEPSGRRGADGATIAALFVMILMLVPARLVLKGVPFALTPAEAVGLVAVVWWFCAHLTDSLGAAKGFTPVRTAIYLYAVAYLITYAYSAAGYLPERELELADHVAIIALAFVGIALLACDGVRGRDRVDLVLKAIVVCGAIIGAIGAAQYLFSFDLTEYMNLPGTRIRGTEPTILVRNGLNRVASTTSHPIEFGVVSAIVLPLALHYALDARERRLPSLRWWLCCLLVAAGMLFSASRSTVLGLLVGGAVLLVGWPAARRWRALLVFAGFLVVVRIAVPGLLGAITSLFGNLDNDWSLRYRTNDYSTAFAEFVLHPLLGRGYGTWYPPYYQVFDNQYLLTAVQGGALGILVFVGLFLTAIWSALRARRLSDDRSIRDLGLSLAASLVIPLVGSATFDLNSFETTNAMAFLLVGVAGALLRVVHEERKATSDAVAVP